MKQEQNQSHTKGALTIVDIVKKEYLNKMISYMKKTYKSKKEEKLIRINLLQRTTRQKMMK